MFNDWVVSSPKPNCSTYSKQHTCAPPDWNDYVIIVQLQNTIQQHTHIGIAHQAHRRREIHMDQTSCSAVVTIGQHWVVIISYQPDPKHVLYFDTSNHPEIDFNPFLDDSTIYIEAIEKWLILIYLFLVKRIFIFSFQCFSISSTFQCFSWFSIQTSAETRRKHEKHRSMEEIKKIRKLASHKKATPFQG